MELQKAQIYIVVGPPGAGKGTQTKRLAEKLGLKHVSTGDLLRDHMRRRTPLGESIRQRMDNGQFVTDEIVLSLIYDLLETAPEGYVFDGFPRNVPQARALSAYLGKLGKSVALAVQLVVEDDEICDRMSGRRVCPMCGMSFHVKHNPPKKYGKCDACGNSLVQRPDDAAETVRARLKTYHEVTEPIAPYYAAKNLLAVVDGSGGVDEVTQAMFDVFE